MTTETTKAFSSLTKHPSGSVRELFTISFPLMLSLLSGNLMMFADRLILARYSLDAMNAAAQSMMVFYVFQLAAVGVASIAEVYVGKAQGSKKYTDAPRYVWQMIYFSLMSTVFFVPLARFGSAYLLDTTYFFEEHAYPYFFWITSFASLFAINTALSSFFIGTGRTRIPSVITILGNVLNVVFDYILVFGWGDLVPSMGAEGAAIATVISQAAQVLILFAFYISPRVREQYQTLNCSLDLSKMWTCIRVGAPSALGHMIEIAAWAAVIRMMIATSEEHVTILVVGQGVYGLVAFIVEGLQRGVIAVASNFIGSGEHRLLYKLQSSALKLLGLGAIVMAIPLLGFSHVLADVFISDEFAIPVERYEQLAQIAFLGVWLYFIFDGLTWTFAGILTAFEDTWFIMAMNAAAAWLFALTPIYLIVVTGGGAASTTWLLLNIYGAINATCFFLRARSMRRRAQV